jgi:hypothetical protein
MAVRIRPKSSWLKTARERAGWGASIVSVVIFLSFLPCGCAG